MNVCLELEWGPTKVEARTLYLLLVFLLQNLDKRTHSYMYMNSMIFERLGKWMRRLGLIHEI